MSKRKLQGANDFAQGHTASRGIQIQTEICLDSSLCSSVCSLLGNLWGRGACTPALKQGPRLGTHAAFKWGAKRGHSAPHWFRARCLRHPSISPSLPTALGCGCYHCAPVTKEEAEAGVE